MIDLSFVYIRDELISQDFFSSDTYKIKTRIFNWNVEYLKNKKSFTEIITRLEIYPDEVSSTCTLLDDLLFVFVTRLMTIAIKTNNNFPQFSKKIYFSSTFYENYLDKLFVFLCVQLYIK